MKALTESNTRRAAKAAAHWETVRERTGKCLKDRKWSGFVSVKMMKHSGSTQSGMGKANKFSFNVAG